MLGRREREALLALRIRNSEAPEPRHSRAPCRRLDQEVVARWRLLTHATGDLEMVRSIRPGALDLALHGGLLIHDDDGVAREQVQQVAE